MKLLLCYLYFLSCICLATTCLETKVKPKVEHNQLNQINLSSKDGKMDYKKDLNINEIDEKYFPVVYESDPKKGQIKSEDVNKVNSTGYTPLLKAVMKNDLVMAKELLLLGADPNIARREDTPISWAVHNKNKDMLTLLLSHGADVIFRKDGKSDILVFFELDNDQEMLDIVLCHFADQDKKDSVGLSPIHWACRDGHLNVVKHILEKYPSIVHNADNPYKFTPLHWAARRGFKEIVELLIATGSSKTVTSKSGFTPLMLAISNNHKALKDILSPDGYSLYPDLVKEDWNCSICLDSFNVEEDKVWTVIPLECGHKFHLTCITDYVSRKHVGNHLIKIPCPYCRNNLSFEMSGLLFGFDHIKRDEKICDVELGRLVHGLFIGDKIDLVTQILLDLIRQGARVNRIIPGGTSPIDKAHDSDLKSILSEAGGISSVTNDIQPAFGLSGSKVKQKILFGKELEHIGYHAKL